MKLAAGLIVRFWLLMLLVSFLIALTARAPLAAAGGVGWWAVAQSRRTT